MGYYTSFNIEIRELNQKPVSDEEFDRAEQGLRETLENVFGKENFDIAVEDFEGGSCWIPEAKWYDCDNDMKELSAKFPEVYFEVTGDGESSEDYWVTYYYQGKQQEGYMAVDVPFNPDKCLNRPMYYIEGAVAMLKQGGYADIAEKVSEMGKAKQMEA